MVAHLHGRDVFDATGLEPVHDGLLHKLMGISGKIVRASYRCHPENGSCGRYTDRLGDALWDYPNACPSAGIPGHGLDLPIKAFLHNPDSVHAGYSKVRVHPIVNGGRILLE